MTAPMVNLAELEKLYDQFDRLEDSIRELLPSGRLREYALEELHSARMWVRQGWAIEQLSPDEEPDGSKRNT